MRITLSLVTLFFLISCGYPDIDDVPKFEEVYLTDEEISDFCSNTNSTKKNIEICINDYKNNK